MTGHRDLDPCELSLEEKAGMIHGAGLFKTAAVERLNIPPLVFSDGPVGVRHEFHNERWETVGNTEDLVSYLPSPSALAATWNKSLTERAGSVLGSEARSRGKDVILAPGVNIMRHPLCGRNFEYFSEDPLLTSVLASAYIRGMQAHDVAACVKHFALNNQETDRLEVNVVVSERALHEIYLPAFEAAVKAGVRTVMCAYNRFEGLYCSESKRLLTEILRDEWGFEGIVVSDWGAVHSTKASAEAGLDVEMSVTSCFDEYFFARPLIEAVKNGEVAESVIDEKIRRIFRLMEELKLFSPHKRARGERNTREHQSILLEAARESIILLKNDGDSCGNRILPLKPAAIRRLTVIGENARLFQATGGNSTEVDSLYEKTALLGISEVLGGNTEIRYAQGYAKEGGEALRDQAVELARDADAVIFVGGLSHHEHDLRLGTNATEVKRTKLPCRIESEGFDRDDMELPYDQEELIRALIKANPNTVIVIQTGSALNMAGFEGEARAIIQTSYNGMEGGRALAEILFGEINPSGKLAYSIPRSLSDAPAASIGEFGLASQVRYDEGIFVGYRHYESRNIPVLFPFGHGLSYTEFDYTNLSLKTEGETVEISLNIRNTGVLSGSETAELYVGPTSAQIVERPVKELKGFDKVYLAPGEKRWVMFRLSPQDFSRFDEKIHGWVCDEGEYRVCIGSSLHDIRLTKNIAFIQGKFSLMESD